VCTECLEQVPDVVPDGLAAQVAAMILPFSTKTCQVLDFSAHDLFDSRVWRL
jgi:hypothetical protein